MRLDDEQRQQAYSIAREEFVRVGRRPGRLRATKAATKERLTGMGWEDILIQLAIAFVTKLITDWIKHKFEDPSAAMPAGFAVGAAPTDLSDDDPE